ncbi:hypothetical protein TNIN_268671, partial [Trichonephila inaurata madagascariensis]
MICPRYRRNPANIACSVEKPKQSIQEIRNDDDDHHKEDHNEGHGGHHEDHYALINSLFHNYDPSSSPNAGEK